MIDELLQKSKEIFSVDYIDSKNIDDKQMSHLDSIFGEIDSEYEWKDIFECWFHLLKTEFNNEKGIINTVLLMIRYKWRHMTVPHPFDPYDFVGYLFAKVDLEKNWDICGDDFDMFVNTILENSNELDLMKNPYYQFWRDPKVIEASKKYRV